MVKTTICIKRKQGISREEFFDYWENHHAELIKTLKDDLKIKRYVQSHSVDNAISAALRASRGGPEMYDGVGEAWFESMETLASIGQDESSLKAIARLIEDESKFIDLLNSPFWVSVEKEII
ncbi:MAG: ethyl tert-butyl ether degradation protein EthD [Thalassolituus sp.]|jgi:hypothetical protein|uniref:EthD domain-containing protein n=1 Tax=unclassified Ketobacter TaxID=2639109 RepID=UPI000F26325A|nr:MULTISPECIES: EthD domain-containing protein [unclassified Ketobacter]RLT89416.1 MAG: EthD family reductase [Ketobacter sp. GenoA1]RLT95737.1 MAG: EthD family reductase [Ketobacter sp.]TNC84010.1 MAG: ethyl tert-butyl ether degradation protein EthD [Thalassolituus sp.]